MLLSRVGVGAAIVALTILGVVVIGTVTVYFVSRPTTSNEPSTVSTSTQSVQTATTTWAAGSDHPNVELFCPTGSYLADHSCVLSCPPGYAPASAEQASNLICMSANNNPVSIYDLAGLQISADDGKTVYLVVPDVPVTKVNIIGKDYTNIWLNVSQVFVDNLVTAVTIPKVTTEVAAVGDTVSTFRILGINQTAVRGNYSEPYPICCTYQPMIIHVGDDVGIKCAGISEVLERINVSNRVATFNKTVSQTSPGGCPICLSGNTFIDTPTGQINVKNLTVGMLVWSVDATGNRIISTVMAVRETPVQSTDEIVHVVLQDGRQLYVSPGHPTADGRLFGRLRVGDFLDGSTIVTDELVPYNQPFTYDLLPNGPSGFYWANGILVGSTFSQPP